MTPSELKRKLKQLKAEKGAISKQFKCVIKGSPEHKNLLGQMQEISRQLKSLEEKIKALSKASEKNSEEIMVAPQFTAPTQIYTGEFTVCIANSDQLALFWDWQKTQERSSIYHTKSIFNWLGQSSTNEPKLLLALDGSGQIIGGLPITVMRTRLFGHFAISQPYFNYGGPLTEYLNVFERLLTFAEKALTDMSLKYAEIRTLAQVQKRPSNCKKVSMLLPLTHSEALLRQSFGAKVRAQVNKANEFAPSVVFGGSELLNDFYHVLSTNMRDLGTPLYEKAWFESLIEALPEHTYLCVVYLAKRPVATGFLIQNNAVMEIPWASTLKKFNHMNINMWMYDQILAFAVTKGCSWFDFGRSTYNEGTYRFKKQWGARPIQHYWYTLGKDNDSAEGGLNPDNPKFKLAIAIWQHLPVWITRIIGPFVAKQLP